jgi:hypothetical protein
MSPPPSPSLRATEERLEAIKRFGGPLFVPGGPWASGWTIAEIGYVNHHGLSSVQASAFSERHRCSVEVTTHGSWSRWISDHALVRRLASEAVPDEVTLPWTLLVQEREADVRLDRSRLKLRVLDASAGWLALGEIDGRWIVISGQGMEPEAVQLRRLKTLDSLSLRRLRP